MYNRRTFLKRSGLAAGALVLPELLRAQPGAASLPVLPASKPLRVLLLGGTGFIGPHMVRQAIARGHKVTLFSRGQSGTNLFPEAERLIGDRNGQLDALRGKTWDVVIDNSGYIPEHVRSSAKLLKDSVGHYFFTSTTDVYRDYHRLNIDESYPLATLPAGAPHDVGRYYGPLKVLCEEAVASTYPDKHTIIRPGWIVGPGEQGHILTYWTMRLDRGGEVLAPGTPDDPTQFIDVRDLAAWVMMMVESQKGGRYNTVGLSIRFGELLRGIQAVTRTPATFTWIDAAFLERNKVTPYFDLPLWWPPRNDYEISGLPLGLHGGIGAFTLNEEKARAAGLTHRPLSDIVSDTLRWCKSEYKEWPDGKPNGLTVARERELLAAWKARH